MKSNNAKAGDLSQSIGFHCLLICLVTILFQGLLLTNDGTNWDSWYVISLTKSRHWATIKDYFNSAGVASYLYFFKAMGTFNNPISAFMCGTFTCALANNILIYIASIRLTTISKSEALCITLLATAIPVYNAAQDLVMLPFALGFTLFLVASILTQSSIQTKGWRHWCLRLSAVFLFFASFTNASLLVLFGGLYILALFRYQQTRIISFRSALLKFPIAYPELLILPPAYWAFRNMVTPQYGWYASYNSPLANLKKIPGNLWSFINVPLFHAKQSFLWIAHHPFAVLIIIGVTIGAVRFTPKTMSFQRGSTPTSTFVWFGSLLLFFAVFPFAAAGKHFAWMQLGENSHYFIQAGLPCSILLFAGIRFVFTRNNLQSAPYIFPTVAFVVMIFGCQLQGYYIAERAEWIFSRSVLHNAAQNEAIRASSLIAVQGFSFAKQTVYGLYGFADALGGMTRYVTASAPQNQKFFTAPEIGKALLATTLLPNEFTRIDPSGQQVFLVAERNRGDATDWDLVKRYLSLKYFGPQKAFDDFLASLTTQQVYLLKPRTIIQSNPEPLNTEAPPNGIPESDFINGSGIRMKRLPSGWWASKFETTQAQYSQVMGHNPSLFKDPARPVECVSWNNATEFCRKLTEQENRAGRLPFGFVYRLPTIAEFDYLSDGSSITQAVMSETESRWFTAPVGSLPANRFGLHDTLGNVWEWCYDWWDTPHRFKAAKGGSWVNRASDLVSVEVPNGLGDSYSRANADRLSGPFRRDDPDQGFWDRGYRCILAPPVSKEIPYIGNR
jgi:hypothetical protein